MATNNAANQGSTGLQSLTSAGVFNGRTITGTSDQITVTNGDGVSGNPTLSFPTTFITSGTWSPVVEGVTTPGVGTYTKQVGTYRRVGSLVWVFGRVVWTAHTGTGVAQINNLPFNTASTTDETQVLDFRTAVTTNTVAPNPQVWVALFGSSPNARPVGYLYTGGSVTGITMPGAGEFIIQGFYEI